MASIGEVVKLFISFSESSDVSFNPEDEDDQDVREEYVFCFIFLFTQIKHLYKLLLLVSPDRYPAMINK